MDEERNSIPRYFLLLARGRLYPRNEPNFPAFPSLFSSSSFSSSVRRSKRPNHGSRTLESTDPAMRQRFVRTSPTTPPSLSRAILVARKEGAERFLLVSRGNAPLSPQIVARIRVD